MRRFLMVLGFIVLVVMMNGCIPQSHTYRALYIKENVGQTVLVAASIPTAAQPVFIPTETPTLIPTPILAETTMDASTPTFTPAPTYTPQSTESSFSTAMEDFIFQVINGDMGRVVGAFSEPYFAFTVVQQPQDNILFVSEIDNVLTEYSYASAFEAVGLLAHNYLAGADFFNLPVGATITLIYGDGRTVDYTVFEIQDFEFLNLRAYRAIGGAHDGEVMDDYGVLNSVYGKDRLVLQTCIEKNGDLSWGRRFIVASKNVQ